MMSLPFFPAVYLNKGVWNNAEVRREDNLIKNLKLSLDLHLETSFPLHRIPVSKVLVWGNQTSHRLVLRTDGRWVHNYRLSEWRFSSISWRMDLGRIAFSPLLTSCVSLSLYQTSSGLPLQEERHIPRRQNLLGPHSLTQMSTSVPNSLALGRSRVLCYKQAWRDPFLRGRQQFLHRQNKLHRHPQRYMGQFLVRGSYIIVSLPLRRHTAKKSSVRFYHQNQVKIIL